MFDENPTELLKCYFILNSAHNLHMHMHTQLHKGREEAKDTNTVEGLL